MRACVEIFDRGQATAEVDQGAQGGSPISEKNSDLRPLGAPGVHMMELVFWAMAAGILYTYAGYSLTILLLAQFVSRPLRRAAIEPRVTYLITAYNEAKNIQGKLEQVLSLDYPHDRLEVLVASDGSTDRTDDIVRQFADRGVRLVRVEGRVGKT